MSYPFIIWTMQRTGGTSLADLLMKMSEHKDAEHEPFNWRKPRQFGHITQSWVETGDDAALDKSLEQIFSEQYLIKHCYELHGTEFAVRLVRAAAKTEYRHILLLRRDELSRLVSKFIAEANGTWFKGYASKVYTQIKEGQRAIQHLPVEAVVKHFEFCREATAEVSKMLASFNVANVKVCYEDIYVGEREKREEYLNGVFDFLDFSSTTIEDHRAAVQENIFDTYPKTTGVLPFVPNLAEVIAALGQAGFEGDSSELIKSMNEREATPGALDLDASPRGPRSAPPAPRNWDTDNAATIHQRGHRTFVGGRKVWDEVGNLQFSFLLERGLTPGDRFIDVACGSLRGGTHFIKYLDAGNYHGIEKHIELIIYGVAKELGVFDFRHKMPHFVISESFSFGDFDATFTFGIAQSLFTHLTEDEILKCLRNLHNSAAENCRLYATFFEAGPDIINPLKSHSAKKFRYTPEAMEKFGTETGWQANYIGDWGHPHNQKMMEYVRSKPSE